MTSEITVTALSLAGVPPSPREAHALVSLDSHRFLVLGGGSISPDSGPQQFNDMYLLDLKEAKWSNIPSNGTEPSPRTGQTATLFGDERLLVFGGSSMTEGYKNDIYVLDTREWVWSHPEIKGKPPSPRDKHTACLVGRKLYVFGGFGPSAAPGEDAQGDEMEEEPAAVDDGDDGDNDNEEQVMNEQSGDEDEGMDEGEEEEEGATMSFTWFDDLHVLDVIDMEWEELVTTGTKPTPRAAHAAFVATIRDAESNELKTKMFVFGGRDVHGRTNDLYTLDIESLEWRKESSNAPPPRSFHVMVPLPGSHVAVSYGGMGVDGQMFKGLEALNLQRMEWTSPKSSNGFWPPVRGATAIVSTNNREEPKLIIFGGSHYVEDQETIYYNDAFVIDVGQLVASS